MKSRLPDLSHTTLVELLRKKLAESKPQSRRKSQPARSAPPTSQRSNVAISDSETHSSLSTGFHEQSYWEEDLYRTFANKFSLSGDKDEDALVIEDVAKVVNTWNAIPALLNCMFHLCNNIKRSLKASTEVRWVSDETMSQVDGIYRSSSFYSNERIYNSTISEPDIINRFLHYRSPRDALSEGEAESGAGAILQKIVSGIEITDKRLVLACNIIRGTLTSFEKELPASFP
jgi:hypothetical protein